MILKQYLECEELLTKFFNKINFCKKYCISQKISMFSPFARGDLGCCLGEFYRLTGKLMPKEFSILDKARIKKYGKPKNNEEPIMGFEKPCSYHTSKGCILKDHKGLACVAYICKPYQDHIKQKYSIDYDYDEIRDFLEDIFLESVDDDKLEQFKVKVNEWIEKIS